MEDRVHPRITDAISETDVKVLGSAPAAALAGLYQTLANSVALASMNAVTAQQQMEIAQQAATTEEVALLLSIGKT